MRSVQADRSPHPPRRGASPACLGVAATDIGLFSSFFSIRIHFPASLRSTVVPRFYATTDALPPAGRFFGHGCHERRLSPAGLPDFGLGTADHSVSNHRCHVRGPPGCPAIWLAPIAPRSEE